MDSAAYSFRIISLTNIMCSLGYFG